MRLHRGVVSVLLVRNAGVLARSRSWRFQGQLWYCARWCLRTLAIAAHHRHCQACFGFGMDTGRFPVAVTTETTT